MAPPTNIDFANATLISSLPYDFTQTDINDAGTNYTVYYKFVAPANAQVVGAFGYGGHIGSGYQPDAVPYAGPSFGDKILNITGSNVPIQFPVTAGSTYYVAFWKNMDTAGPESLRVQLEVAPHNEIPDGSILVNDDSNGFPLAALSSETDRTVVRFVKSMPAGEAGDVLENGIMCFEDYYNKKLKFYNPGFTLIKEVAYTPVPRIRACYGQKLFYVGSHANPPVVSTYNDAGTVGGTTWSLTGSSNLLALAASNDGKKLYYAQANTTTPIKVWDLENDIALTDLVANLATYYVCDMFVLGDDTLLVLYNNLVLASVIMKRFDSSGTLLNTYDLSPSEPEASIIVRGAYAIDEPNSFWVWIHPATGQTRFLNVKVSDGSIITTRNFDEFEAGIWQQGQAETPTSRFGNSYSCPFLIYRAVQGGIYYINPDKATKHDSYYGDKESKIPDPTFRIAYLGE